MKKNIKGYKGLFTMLFNINKIEKGEFYFDLALKEGDKRAAIAKSKTKGKTRLEKSRYIEINKINIILKNLKGHLENIEKSFPSFENLPLFYKEVIDMMVGIDNLKISISSLSWLKIKSEEIGKKYIRSIRRCDKLSEIGQLRKEFVGRLKSMIKKINKHFIYLDNVRKKFRNLPTVKINATTYCICGCPNVGKSTLLSHLTPANPEINIYPFTTKYLMFGYIGKKIQIIDTPGAFRTDLDKMNHIEKLAYLAIKHLADTIIYVFDLSETCGYSIKKQEELFENIQNKFSNRQIIIYFSKTDLLKEDLIKKYKNKYKKYKIYTDLKFLRKSIKRNPPPPLFHME